MRTEPRGIMGTFWVTKTYKVTATGNSIDDCYEMMDSLDPEDVSEDDFVEMEYKLVDGFEYDSF